MLPAKIDKLMAAVHTVPGLIATGLIVNSGVDDPGIVAGLVCSDPVLFLKHQNSGIGVSE